VWAILADRLRERLLGSALAGSTSELLDAVADHRTDPYAVVDRLMKDLGSDRS
jgi:hypothetical protein